MSIRCSTGEWPLLSLIGWLESVFVNDNEWLVLSLFVARKQEILMAEHGKVMELCIIDLEVSVPLIIFFFSSGEAALIRVAVPAAIIAANLVM